MPFLYFLFVSFSESEASTRTVAKGFLENLLNFVEAAFKGLVDGAFYSVAKKF